MTKDEAICKHLNSSINCFKKNRMIHNNEDEQIYIFNKKEGYLVLTDSEVNLIVSKTIQQKLCEFSTDQLLKFMDTRFKYGIISMIQSFGPESGFILRQLMGEKFNDFVNCLCNDNNGNNRSRFISTGRSKENRVGQFFIYKLY